MCRRIGFGRDAGCCFEHAVKVIRAQTRALRQRSKSRCLLCGFDQATGFRHTRGMDLLEWWPVRPAPAARTESRSCRFRRRLVKAHVPGVRPARSAGRTAIHPGCRKGLLDGAVRPAVARDNRRPPRVQRRRMFLSHHALTMTVTRLANTPFLALESLNCASGYPEISPSSSGSTFGRFSASRVRRRHRSSRRRHSLPRWISTSTTSTIRRSVCDSGGNTE